MDMTLLEPPLRLLAAVAAGSLIGLDRDLHGKPTGLRIHALVALGAAILTSAGAELSARDPAAASRIIQGIVGGIGFLGAGVIMRSDHGTRIVNLTTATSIWLTAALGVVCGLGDWKLAGMGSAAAFVVLVAGRWIDRALFGRLGPEDEPPPPDGNA